MKRGLLCAGASSVLPSCAITAEPASAKCFQPDGPGIPFVGNALPWGTASPPPASPRSCGGRALSTSPCDAPDQSAAYRPLARAWLTVFGATRLGG